MNSRFQSAMTDALARLKTSDIAGATAVIRQALARDAGGTAAQPTPQPRRVDARVANPRGLGDLLNVLGSQRVLRPGAALMPKASAADEADGDCFSARS